MLKILIPIFVLFTLLPAQMAFSQVNENPTINFELPSDVEPPIFSHATDITVEASNGLGAVVTYVVPAVSDNVGIVSGPNCLPTSGSTFALGVSIVTCTASDAEGNVGMTTFSVIVHDTTPPIINAPADITVENVDNQNIPLGIPSVSDIVDPFPVISNDFTTLLVGENIVTWTATDFSGNSVSAKQIVKLISTNSTDGKVLPSNIFVFEATGPDGAKIDPSVLGILDISQISCQPSINSIFPLGQNQLLCTELNNTNSTLSFTIVVQDTTPPRLLASFAPIQVEDNEGIFAIEIISTDLVDSNPIVTANINKFPVINGQLVKLELDSETEIEHKTDLIKFEGTRFVLFATSSDFSGNTVAVTSLPQFEIEKEELVEEQIEAIEEESELAEEELEKEIETIEEEAELTKEQLEDEIEALEEVLEDVDSEKQNEMKSQIESIKIAIDELEKQTESIVENKKNEIESLKKQKESEIQAKKNEIEQIKIQKEKDDLLSNIHKETDSRKQKELDVMITSALEIIKTDHHSNQLFQKLAEQKTLQSHFESDDADSRKKLDELGLLDSTSSDEMKGLAKEEEKIRESALKELEELIKNAENLGDDSLKEIEDLAKEELHKKEQELKEIEKFASSVSDESEKKRIEKEIKLKKKVVEDFKKQKEAEFEKHKKEQEHYKKELEKALEEQKKESEKEKKVIEKAIEKQKEFEEKAKQAQKEAEEKKKEIEEKAKEAEKKAEEQQKSESGESSSGSSNNDNDSDDDDDDGDDDDD